MSSRVENIKYLRDLGASHKLLDDAAKKVGGYDSPLFVPTVEFIMKLQNAFLTQSQSQSQEVTAGMPNAFDPDKLKGVDLESAAEVMQSQKMDKGQKKQAVVYIEAMAVKRDDFLAQNPDFDAEKNLIPRKKKDRKQQVKQSARKTNLISQIAAGVKAMMDQMAQTMQNNRQNAQNSFQQQAPKQQEQGQKQSAQNTLRVSSRKNLMSLFSLKKAQMAHHEVHDYQQGQHGKQDQNPKKDEFLKKLKKDVRIAEIQNRHEQIGDRELLEAAKQARTELGNNVSKDIMISKIIDNLVKAVDKGDKKDLAKNSIDEAVAKLQSTGVKPITSADQQIDNKKALEDQHKQMQEQNAQLKR